MVTIETKTGITNQTASHRSAEVRRCETMGLFQRADSSVLDWWDVGCKREPESVSARLSGAKPFRGSSTDLIGMLRPGRR